MVPDVNGSPQAKRRYDASGRLRAAADTRLRILNAARDLFATVGYAATTVAIIAERAAVAPDTVYAAVGTKPLVFRELIELALSGQDEPVPGAERDYAVGMRAQSDAVAKLAIYAEAVTAIQGRLAPLLLALRDAASSDEQLAAVWRQISQRRAHNMRALAADLARTGQLRGDLSHDEIADVIWTMNGSEYYAQLVTERGWSPRRFQEWLQDAWCRLLLAPGDESATRPPLSEVPLIDADADADADPIAEAIPDGACVPVRHRARGDASDPHRNHRRDRDAGGRPRQARPRDDLGRPLPYGAVGSPPISEVALPPEETVATAQGLLRDGLPFAAHETYEVAWKRRPAAERDLWQGMAQVCAGLTHAARGNGVGAARLIERGAERLSAYAATGAPTYGLNLDDVISAAKEQTSSGGDTRDAPVQGPARDDPLAGLSLAQEPSASETSVLPS